MITKVEGSDTRSARALPLLYGPETERRIAAIGFAPGLFFFGVETTGVPSPLELHRRPVHRYGMEERGWIERHGFWPLALLWLPAGVAARAVVRFLMATAAPPDPGMWVAAVPMAGSVAGRAGPLRPAPGPRLPPPLAAGLPARSLVDRHHSRLDNCGGVGVRGTAWARGDRHRCADIQSSRVGRLVVAGLQRVSAGEGGPAAQQREFTGNVS